MSNSSSSKTSRTYNTTNVSQQGEGANVNGRGNTTTVYRADAIALDNIAKALTEGVTDLSSAGVKQTEAALDSNTDVSKAALSTNESVTREAIDLANRVAQGAENGTDQALDFVANYSERAQVGNADEATKTVMWVAAVAGVTLVGIAWASKGGFKA